MKYILSIVVIAVLIGCSQASENKVNIVSSSEMKEIMSQDSIQLIDVRSLKEFREGHLKNAQNIIYDEDFAEKIKTLDKSRSVAVYCQTGRRSSDCSEILKKAGFEKIYDLDGGLSEWKYKEELVKE
ncbi:rhodanese-like domain-containing protein [Psychroflexus aestuariivivens]|uniref:rhodanese-like domain-containing protein n=1 Tax=Psychroflexus aestuariivivens TaxID=1795040 RepID=UPI000FDB3587|nr:rhodanese-like domain-containing protein [Psychroflexus aestuariivivens]